MCLKKTRNPVSVVALFSASALVLGCGSRLEVASSASASGAGGGSTTVGSGTGGSSMSCTSLVVSGDPITYDATPEEHGGKPRLVAVDESGSRVSAVYYQQGIELPGSGFPHILSATFEPWEAWPKGLGKGVQASLISGEAFAISPAGASEGPGFSLLYYLPTNAFPSDMFMAPVVVPGQNYDWSPLGVQWDSWEPAWPVALSRGENSHLAAYQLGMGNDAYMSLAIINDGSLSVSVIDEIACANAPFTVDVTSTTGGFLVATAAGRPFGACLLDDGIPGPAEEIQVIKVDAITHQSSLSAVFPISDQLAHVALAKRPSGAWLVYHGMGANAEFPPPIMGILLDETGAPLLDAQVLSDESAGASAFAAAALNDKLLLAWFESSDTQNPVIRLDLFDDKGALLSHSSLVVPAPFLYDPYLSLLVSKDSTNVLVAWSDFGGSGAATARVARLSCVGSP